jgi:hypothetical protein
VHEIPLWVTVTVWPATVKVPTRWLVEVFAVAVKATVPLPDPLPPLVMVSQPVLWLTAVQAQPAGAVTPVVDDPAADVSVAAVGATVKVHGGENWNWFERAERVEPPGPTAATVDS